MCPVKCEAQCPQWVGIKLSVVGTVHSMRELSPLRLLSEKLVDVNVWLIGKNVKEVQNKPYIIRKSKSTNPTTCLNKKGKSRLPVSANKAVLKIKFTKAIKEESISDTLPPS